MNRLGNASFVNGQGFPESYSLTKLVEPDGRSSMDRSSILRASTIREQGELWEGVRFFIVNESCVAGSYMVQWSCVRDF